MLSGVMVKGNEMFSLVKYTEVYTLFSFKKIKIKSFLKLRLSIQHFSFKHLQTSRLTWITWTDKKWVSCHWPRPWTDSLPLIFILRLTCCWHDLRHLFCPESAEAVDIELLTAAKRLMLLLNVQYTLYP